MNSNPIYRIVLDILIFLAIIHGWWFIAAPLACIGAWRYRYFFELIIAGLIYDSLFGLVPEMSVAGYIGIATSSCAFLCIYLLKKILRK